MWFSEVLSRPCSFVRCLASENDCCLDMGSKGRLCRDIQRKMNFANEAQLLLLSESSINDLNCQLRSNKQTGNSRSE
ncbi:molybdenum cofactor sulfurase isoform X1 [Iris pallida]|uniref:Molybdenum cofactor sulfurase isoform X1 n=1 Tax=Iris pallida TaxID=29817 RepID=A0AAX6F2P9_IRIPA|nr:molybdenum cofactor sulfurase isoform X1 [Iris pallida]